MLHFNPTHNASFASSSDTIADSDEGDLMDDPFTTVRSPNPARNPNARGRHVYTPSILKSYQAEYTDKPTPDWDAKLLGAGVLGQPRDTWTAGYLARLNGTEKQERALDWKERQLWKEEKELQRKREKFEREKKEAEAKFKMIESMIERFQLQPEYERTVNEAESKFKMFESSMEKHRPEAERIRRDSEVKFKMAEQSIERAHSDGKRNLTAMSTHQAMGQFEYPVSAQKLTKKAAMAQMNTFTPLKYTGKQEFVPQKHASATEGNKHPTSMKPTTPSSAKKPMPLTISTDVTTAKPASRPHDKKKDRQTSFSQTSFTSSNSSPLKHMISASDLDASVYQQNQALPVVPQQQASSKQYTLLVGPAAQLLAQAQHLAGLSTLSDADVRALTDLGAGMQLGELTVPTAPYITAEMLNAAARLLELVEGEYREGDSEVEIQGAKTELVRLMDGPPAAVPALYLRPESLGGASTFAGTAITVMTDNEHNGNNAADDTNNSSDNGALTTTAFGADNTTTASAPYPTYPPTRTSTVRILNVPRTTPAVELLTFLEEHVGAIWTLDVETPAPGFQCKTGRAVFMTYYGGAEQMLRFDGVLRLGGAVLRAELVDCGLV